MSSLEPVPAAVVYNINVLVTAAASGNSPFRSWPSPPPVSGNASADCLGVIVDAAEFALWLSPHITANIDRVLAQLFKWSQPQIDAYLRATLKVMKSIMIADQLREAQAYGQQRTAELDIDASDVPARVQDFLKAAPQSTQE